MVSLLVFGEKKDPVTGCSGYHNCFDAAFSKEKNIEACEKVGAAPLTWACLKDKQVRHEVFDDYNDNNDIASMYVTYKRENNLICDLLTQR